ncbi:MAG: hypothetical protein HN457_09700, partial [Opitutales bacterium]|nr:hypothetical protein [Opitutales bacterium]
MNILSTAIESAHATSEVSQGVTLFFTFYLVAMIFCLALEEKLHAKKSLIVGLFAVGALIIGTTFHIIPFGAMMLPGGHAI